MTEASLHEVVNAFIGALRTANAQPISAPFVAESVVAQLPHADIFTRAEREAAYAGVSNAARSILQDRHSTEYDATRIGQESLDLPEAALLNGGYSVLRGKEPVYVPRLQMTRHDMEYVCRRFDALSGYFARASRALRADFERRNSLAA